MGLVVVEPFQSLLGLRRQIDPQRQKPLHPGNTAISYAHDDTLLSGKVSAIILNEIRPVRGSSDWFFD